MPETMPFNRVKTGKRVDRASAKYHKALADLAFLREDLYEAINEAHPEDPQAYTLRELAAMTGLSFGRIGQIVRGE